MEPKLSSDDSSEGKGEDKRQGAFTELARQLARQGYDAWRNQMLGQDEPPRPEEPAAKISPLFAQLAEEQQQPLISVVDYALRQIGHTNSSDREGSEATTNLDNRTDPDLAKLLDFLASPEPVDLVKLLTCWRHRDPALWSRTPQLHRRLAERLLEVNEPLLAYDVSSEGLNGWPADTRLTQLQGVSLSRSGATARANAIFGRLRREGHTDEETVGNLARTYKDLWLQCQEPARKNQFLTEAYQAYLEAFRTTRGYWSGVNAATLALASGNRAQAIQWARTVHELCTTLLAGPRKTDHYWILATLGEASLILGRQDEAIDWYRQAVKNAGGRIGNVSSTRQQARLICQYLDTDWSLLNRYFPLPRVVLFTGHMIDHPNRQTPRFPESLVPVVQRELRRRVSAWKPIVGYASAACGSDILFLETLLEQGAETYVVLPCPPEQFLAKSVVFSGTGHWRERFEAVLRQVSGLSILSPDGSRLTSLSYDYTNRVLSGLARMQATRLGTPLSLLAVWDGKQDKTVGGASSLVRRWQQQGRPVEWIDLDGLLRDKFPDLSDRYLPGMASQRVRKTVEPQIMAMLFADVKGYSQLSEHEVLRFVQEFFGAIADLTDTSSCQPITRNTWGDGLYYTFSSIREAGRFALDLADLVAKTDWSHCDLPADLSIRIALHAGPVYPCVDPVTDHLTYSGAHVSRAARIEPITPPGQVYASQAFAALAADDSDCDFQCQYVGQTPLAKNYGTLPTYHVMRLH